MIKLVIGCGYLGLRVAMRWLEAGATVYAVTRSSERAGAFERQGLKPIVADVTVPDSLARLPAAQSVLYSLGYDRLGGASRTEVQIDGIRHVLDALSPDVERIVFASTTGIYGQEDGQVVDEDSPAEPTSASGQAALASEAALKHHPLGRRAIILRLAGLYGPGRVPNRAAIASGEPIAALEAGYLNLIYVDDAAEAVLAAERRGRPPRTYCVTDGNPCRRGEFYAEVARLLGAAPPRFVASTAAASARGGSSKRVSNARAVAELALAIRHPSYRQGLAAAFGEDEITSQ